MSSSALRRRCLAAACLLVLAGLVAASCTFDSGDRRAVGTVPTTLAPLAELSLEADAAPTVPLPPGFVPEDTRGEPLLGVPRYDGLDQPPIPVTGGKATLRGRVQGPEGEPLGGATVRLERFVGDRGGFIDVGTNEDGEYSASGLRGGHFRVRAWVRPNLATVAPQATFLEEDASLTVDVALELHEGRRLSAAVSVPEPEVGVGTFLQALVQEQEVDEDGVVRGEPVPDVEVSVLPLEGVRIDSDNPATTDEAGIATFVLMCLSPAAHTVAVFADGEQFAYEVPACKPGSGEIPPPPTSEPDPDTPTTTAPSAVFPVGGSFAPPFAGPVPAGTYVAVSGGSSCQTTYEVYANGRWLLTQTNGGSLRLPAVTRSFRSVGFSTPCTFRRVR